MRVDVAQTTYALAPAESFQVEVEVYNSLDVIDGIEARVIGLDPAWVVSDPPELPLFPESSGRVRLTIRLPDTYPAGEHRLTIEVRSTVRPSDNALVDLHVTVSPRVDALLRVEPAAITGTKRAVFEIAGYNRGNTTVGYSLLGSDSEDQASVSFDPPFLEVPPDGEARALMRVRGKRPFFGNSITRALVVTGVASDHQLTAAASFTQRPKLPRGAATVAILAGIVALWAAAFTIGIDAVLDDEEAMKAVPASFFAASPAGAGVVPELDVATVGGSIVGRVVSVNDEGVGRVTVEAVRDGPNGPVLAAAAASEDDGQFAVSALLPGSYKLRFSAPGFVDVWYGGGTGRSTAEVLRVTSDGEADAGRVQIQGEPGSIAGRVDTGGLQTVPTQVSVRSSVDERLSEVLTTVTTGSDGTYSVTGLATPGDYELAFEAPGFDRFTEVVTLGGGENLGHNTVRLSAGPGTITGVVVDEATRALGNVDVVATSGEEEFSTKTPTGGTTGVYQLTDLPTPGTYLLTFTADGFGTETRAIDLGPGGSAEVDVVLERGTGTISGTVVDDAGAELGGVEVAVSGEGVQLTTTTLTAGKVGTYTLTGLPTPGNYTVTFLLDGYATESRTVALAKNAKASGIDAELSSSIGSIAGTVTDGAGQPLAGVAVTATDGAEELGTETAGDPPGRYALTDLAPASYSVTFSRDGFRSRTVLVEVAPGDALTVDVVLEAEAAA